MALLETWEPHEKGIIADVILRNNFLPTQVLAELSPENADSFGSQVEAVLSCELQLSLALLYSPLTHPPP